MSKRDPYEVKQKCGRCTRERYELIKWEDKYVCNNCWNYLYKKSKEGGRG